jgi:hypothetical protein
MPDTNPTQYDDEIDLLEVLETLWESRLWILASMLIPLSVFLLMAYVSVPAYEVLARFSVRVDPMNGPGSIDARLTVLSNGEWRPVNGGSALLLTTESPQTAAEYQDSLAELNKALGEEIRSEAQLEASFLEAKINDSLRRDEWFASIALKANRVLFLLEQEGEPLEFAPVSINPVTQSSYSSAAMPTFLSALACSVFILLRKAFRDRRIRNSAKN